MTKECDPTLHAEVDAIRKACKKLGTIVLSDYILYSSCEPCPMCFSAIYWAGIQQVYFSADRHDAHDGGFADAMIYKQLTGDGTNAVELKCIPSRSSIKPFDLWREDLSSKRY